MPSSAKSRKSRRGLTPEQRHERLSKAHEQLQTAVETLTSSEGWRTLLASRAWLRRYSFNNLLMIMSQRPHATDVRPMSEWNAVGRRVRKGETGIRIFAPCRYKAEPDDSEEAETKPRYEVRGFTVVSVFDVAQTEGDPLPATTSVVPEELQGLAPKDLWDRVAGLITARGYTIERGDCGSAYGWVDFTTTTVRVRGGVEPAQAVKTLVHELAHIWCEHASRAGLTRARKEIEAESVACLTAELMGLDTLAYSVPYVAHWAEDAATAQDSAERVLSAAEEITAALQEHPHPAVTTDAA